MEEIKILFFILASFFGREDGRIAAEKTTVTINPEKKTIEIIQEDLFAVIQSQEDSITVLRQWEELISYQENTPKWSKELATLPSKKFDLKSIKNEIQPHLILNYSQEEDLRPLGIWYNKEKNQFTINNILKDYIKTDDGKLEGNYWVFEGNRTFSFTIEPFLDTHSSYENYKMPLKDIIDDQGL
ncbi:hypothetical protein [Zunongwangia endophytica]|uniref:Uncharacterized protein n=1 Tax=Zunongwangia endophytica TaxID=1808945 RepID=A0ABV8HCT9_9FLAO|nr:hypothetical protein [Zunongwangia endophytica]MDN3593785.1 hypothetical protein [Zunongwangia endophytica]